MRKKDMRVGLEVAIEHYGPRNPPVHAVITKVTELRGTTLVEVERHPTEERYVPKVVRAGHVARTWEEQGPLNASAAAASALTGQKRQDEAAKTSAMIRELLALIPAGTDAALTVQHTGINTYGKLRRAFTLSEVLDIAYAVAEQARKVGE